MIKSIFSCLLVDINIGKVIFICISPYSYVGYKWGTEHFLLGYLGYRKIYGQVYVESDNFSM